MQHFGGISRSLSQCAQTLRRLRPALWLCAGLLGSAASPLQADTAATRAQQAELRQALEAAGAEYARSESAHRAEQEQLQALLAQQVTVRAELRTLEARIAEHNAQLQAREQGLAALERERAGSLGRLEDLSRIFAQARAQQTQGAREQAWLRHVGQQRVGLLQKLAASAAEQTRLRDAQVEQVAALQADRAARQQQQERLQRLAQAHRDMLAELDTKLASDAQTREALAAQLAATERLLQQLQRAPSPPAGVKLPGLAARKGQLTWPARGRVLRRFGSTTANGKSQGTLIDLPLDTEVPAIADAHIAWIGWLPQRGLVMVLDHGADYYSLYAHASTTLLGVGDRVAAGTPVIRSGQSGGLERPGLYLEIRQGRTALNPRGWFRNGP